MKPKSKSKTTTSAQTPAGPVASGQQPARRSRRWLIGAAVLFAVGAGTWYWWPSSPPAVPAVPADVHDPELQQALEQARERVQQEPRSASVWGDLGILFLAHSYDAEADSCFAEASRLDPQSAQWAYYRGIYALRFDPDRAVPFLRQAATGTCPEEYRGAVRLRLAETLLERGERDEAEQLFLEELRDRPRDPRAAFGLGVIARERGDDRRAAEMLNVARASPTVRKPATAHLAALARKRGDAESADRLEQEAAALPGGPAVWPDPLLDLASRRQVGQQKRLRERPRVEDAPDLAEAAQAFQNELQTQPSTRAYLGAGFNFGRMGDFDRALPLLREAIQRDPDNYAPYFALAQVLVMRVEAELKKAPDFPGAKTAFREIAETARQSAERKPDHANSYLLWGRALMRLGEPAAAIEPLRKGVACRPESFNLQLALGEALLETKAFAEAEKHLLNAAKLAPKDPRPEQTLERLRKLKG
jgi:tetratricopeptide (TPR) repeat protein